MSKFDEYLEEQSKAILKLDERIIKKASDLILEKSISNNSIWVAGNGGSATTAAHMATDLSKGVFSQTGIQIRAICLNEFIGIQTAWANDEEFNSAIANSLKSFAKESDLVILISGSGNSPNILNAASAARELKLNVLSLTGMGGGKLAPMSDIAIVVDSFDMQTVENVHLVVNHILYKILAKH
jgi:D-sedoheptulose 7-phosphate isomerase